MLQVLRTSESEEVQRAYGEYKSSQAADVSEMETVFDVHVRNNNEDCASTFEALQEKVAGTDAEPLLLAILQSLLMVRDDDDEPQIMCVY